MPEGATLQLEGYTLAMKLLAASDKASRKAWRDEIRQATDHVRVDASRLFAGTNSRSATGYRTRVRQRGAAVEQSIRKTTGRHPEYGALQMRKALLPALYMNEDRTVRQVEQALDRICDRFNGVA